VSAPAYDDPSSIQAEEARQELRGRPGGKGAEAFVIIAVVFALVLVAVAIETIDHWSQWVVLGAIILTVVGFMIALSPNRRG